MSGSIRVDEQATLAFLPSAGGAVFVEETVELSGSGQMFIEGVGVDITGLSGDVRATSLLGIYDLAIELTNMTIGNMGIDVNSGAFVSMEEIKLYALDLNSNENSQLFLTGNIKWDDDTIFTNVGTINLYNGSILSPSELGGTSELINLSGGSIIKHEDGLATVNVAINNEGLIDLQAGNLTFNGGGTFGENGENSAINIAGGGELRLTGSNTYFFAMDPPTNDRNTTTVTAASGDGTFVIDADIAIWGNHQLILQSDVLWESGVINFQSYTYGPYEKLIIGGEENSVQFVTSGSGQHVFENHGVVIVNEGSSFVQNHDIILNKATTISTYGTYNLNNGDILLENYLPAFLMPFHEGSTFDIKADTSHVVEIDVNIREGATLLMNSGSSLSLPLSLFTLSDGHLKSGNWILSENSTITLTQSVSNSATTINSLGTGVSVTLEAGASFGNLPTVLDDFSVYQGATLRLNGTTFTAYENFYANGNLTGNNGVLNVFGTLYNGTGDGLLTAILAGNLTVNAASGVVNTDWVSPGNSPGTLTINGDYLQTSTGVLDIEIGGTIAGTEYDQLIVNGMATFEAGSTINVTFLDLDGDGMNFTPSTGDTFDFLVTDDLVLAEGASFGDYLNFTNIPQGLRWEYELISMDGITLWQLYAIFGSSFTEISGLSGNLLSVGTAFDTATTTTGSDGLLNLALAIGDLDSTSQITSLSQASFNFASGLYDLSNASASSMSGHMSARLDDLLWGTTSNSQRTGYDGTSTAPQYAFNSIGPRADISIGEAVSSMAVANGSADQMFGNNDGLRMGLTVSYENGKFDPSANQMGLDYDGYSLSSQLEYGNLDGNLIVGVSAAYADLSGDASDAMGSVKSDGFGIGFYGMARVGDYLVIDGSLMKSWGNVESMRSVDAGAESFTAEGKADSDSLQIQGRISAPMDWTNFRVAPFASLEYSKTSLDGFTESASSDGALTMSSSRIKTGNGQLGIMMATAYKSDFQANISVAWDHTFKQSVPSLSASFVGAPSQSFAIAMDQRSKNAVRLSANVSKNIGKWQVSAGYRGRIASDGNNHSLMARASMRF